MKFERLEIIRFGALEGVSIDLSKGSPGLHVVYGDNEAGKTTVRRAISALLFGIPERTPDNFRFDNKDLRLGATLRLADGAVTAFLRKKARKSDVLDLQEHPLKVPWLETLGRELGLDRFLTEWSLDHTQLRTGGQELAEGKGRVGESLLSAGLGGLPVSKLLEALGTEAGELFRPNAQAPKVNELLRRIQELRAELTARGISPKDFDEKERHLAELTEERRKVAERRDEAQRALGRLERIERARPSLARRKALKDELSTLAKVPRVGTDFGTRRIEAAKAADDASASLESAGQQLAALEKTLSSIEVDTAALESGAELEALTAGTQVFEACREELQKLAQSASDTELSIAADARGLGMEPAALIALARGPWQRHAANLRSVGDGLAEAGPQVERLAEEVEDCRRQLDGLVAREGQLPPDEDVTALQRAHAALIAEGPPDMRLGKARQQAERAEEAAARAFDGLSRWTQSRGAFEKAALPSLDGIEAHADALKVEPDEGAVETARAELEKRKKEKQRLEARGEVPSLAALEKARKRRDQGWKLVRQQLEGDAPAAAAVTRFAGEDALPDAYEQTVVHADVLADGLREDADRVAKFEGVCERIEEATQALEKAEATLSQQRKALQKAEKEWRALWAPFELEPGSPKVMRTWLATADAIRRELLQAQEAKKALAQLESELLAQAAPMAAAMGRPAPSLDGVPALVTEADAKLRAAQAAATERHQLQQALAETRGKLATRQAQLDAARRRRDELQQARGELAVALGLPSGVTLEELRVVIARVTDVSAKLQQRDRDEKRSGELKARTDEFESAVRALARRLGSAGTDQLRPEVLAHGLAARLKAAREADQERKKAEALRAQAQRAREEAAARRTQAEKALARLCEEAGTKDPADLVQVQEQNEQRRQLEKLLRECEDALLSQAPSDGLEALADEVASVPADETAARKTAASEELHEATERHTALTGEIAVLEDALRAIRGTDEAAEKNAELQSALAQLREHSAAWLRLKYAESLLQGAVERFREQNQSPVLRRAGELFARLTLGAYPAIEVSGEDEEAVLEGVRLLPDGSKEPVGTHQMSDGTRDQLFLALRIAVLEQELAAREPLPVVVDDILIQLSDNRARAALEVLAELAQRAQVLLFTHHRRVAELAQGLKVRDIFVHELAAPAQADVRAALFAG